MQSKERLQSHLRLVRAGTEAGNHLGQPFNLHMRGRWARIGKVTQLISGRAGAKTHFLYFYASVLSLKHECWSSDSYLVRNYLISLKYIGRRKNRHLMFYRFQNENTVKILHTFPCVVLILSSNLYNTQVGEKNGYLYILNPVSFESC